MGVVGGGGVHRAAVPQGVEGTLRPQAAMLAADTDRVKRAGHVIAAEEKKRTLPIGEERSTLAYTKVLGMKHKQRRRF